MAAVTQSIGNFLGGISQQVDSKKLVGQVRDVINGVADPTFGMKKRLGYQFLRVLRKSDGSKFSKNELDGASWFFYQSGGVNNAFFGCIHNAQIHIWNSFTGYYYNLSGTSTDYLTGNNFHFRNIQDTTIITNKDVLPQMSSEVVPHIFNTRADVVLVTIEYGAKYVLRFKQAGQPDSSYIEVEYKTRNYDDLAAEPDPDNPDETVERLDAEEILSEIKKAIEEKSELSSLGLSVTQFKTSLYIESNTQFKIKAEGGISGVSIYCFQDAIDNLSRLPPESVVDRKVVVENASGAEDNFYLQYLEKDPEKGSDDADSERDGVWKECIGFNIPFKLDASRMPHILEYNVDTDGWTFKEETWKNRIAGDDTTVPVPSFCEQPNRGINCTFFWNNRLGFLCGDFIILSVANDPTNFFALSAVTAIDSDPVDINVSSTQPTELYEVLPASTGLQLFSSREQFLLTGDGLSITPSNALTRSQSRYEMDIGIAPKDLGVRDVYVSKVPGYTRLFTMQQVGTEEVPAVIDISKVVSNYIPENIDLLDSSPQNSFCIMASTKSNEAFLWSFWNNGEQDLFQSWTKWELPGNPQALVVVQDSIFSIMQYNDEYCIGFSAINNKPVGLAPSTASAFGASPCLDMYLTAINRPGLETVDIYYLNGKTVFDTPYSPIPGYKAYMIMCDIGTPFTTFATSLSELAVNFSGTLRDTFEPGIGFFKELSIENNQYVLDGDWTAYTGSIVVGLGYDFTVDLPKYYMNIGNPDAPVYDWTANLTVARTRFQLGMSGEIDFKLKAKGSEEWSNLVPTPEADYYLANDSPTEIERTVCVPIYQRNMNFDLKVTSDKPFPVSLVSMMWEGQYSPKNYKRA